MILRTNNKPSRATTSLRWWWPPPSGHLFVVRTNSFQDTRPADADRGLFRIRPQANPSRFGIRRSPNLQDQNHVEVSIPPPHPARSAPPMVLIPSFCLRNRHVMSADGLRRHLNLRRASTQSTATAPTASPKTPEGTAPCSSTPISAASAVSSSLKSSSRLGRTRKPPSSKRRPIPSSIVSSPSSSRPTPAARRRSRACAA